LPNELFTGDNTILSKPFSPTVTKFFMYQAHYRSILDFSSDALEAAEKGYNRMKEAFKNLNTLPTGKDSTMDISAWKQSCYDAMNDDFNSPILIAQLFEAAKFINSVKDGKASITPSDLEILKTAIHSFVFEVLGLQEESISDTNSTKLSDTVALLINLRKEARENKDFATSDKIRDELTAIGIQLKDGKDGTTFSL